MTSKNVYFSNINRGLDNISFDLTGVDTSVANTIRRSILSEIPVYGFEDEPKRVFSSLRHNGISIPKGIHIVENTTSLHNEFISHRIGLIPIYSKRQISSSFHPGLLGRVFTTSCNQERISKLEDDLMKLPSDSEERTIIEEMLVSERDMPLFKLDIKNDTKTRKALKSGSYFKELGDEKKIDISTKNVVSVTSDMFHLDDHKQNEYIKYDPKIFEEFDGRREYSLLVTLKPGVDDDEGQSLKVDVRPNPGIARYHSKYCPVGTVQYSFKRDNDERRIRNGFEQLLARTNRTRGMKGLDLLEGELFGPDGEMISDDVEIQKLWRNYEILDRDKIYELDGSRPKYFQFNIESIGSLEPYQIVHDAIYMLRLKLIDLYNHVGDDSIKYVDIMRSKSIMKGVDIVVQNENHTMGNIITHYLNENANVEFAGYKMPHPLQEKIVIRISLLESSDMMTDTIAIFKDSIYKCISTMTDLIKEWTSKNTDVYKRLLDNTTEEFLNKMSETDKTSSVGSTKSKKRRIKIKKRTSKK